MLKTHKRIAIVDSGHELFSQIEKILSNTEGYKVERISDDSNAIIDALNDHGIVSVIYDLKNIHDLQLIVDTIKDNSMPNNIYQLTNREHKIMVSLDKGLLYKEISESLELTLGTFKQYTHIIYKKLSVSNKTEAINKYFNRKN
jgi:DNA-binding CsgD family transcriptional regulator